MTPTQKTYRNFLREVRKTPTSWGFRYVYDQLKTLAACGYFDPTKPWAQADQLSNAAKFLFLFGPRRIKGRPITISNLFNRYKDFWTAAEAENPYTSDSGLVGLFVLRLVYQQYPHRIFENRVPRMLQRTVDLYLAGPRRVESRGFDPSREFEKLAGIGLEPFLRIAERTYSAFKRSPFWDYKSLTACLDGLDATLLPPFLQAISADRDEFHDLYETTNPDSLHEIPYAFNPLLRYPILRLEGQLWAPFPELIVYAATQVLFFYLSDNLSAAFNHPSETYLPHMPPNSRLTSSGRQRFSRRKRKEN